MPARATILLLGGLIALPVCAEAQLLRGRVLDATTRQPLPSTEVSLTGATSVRAIADSAGWFRLAVQPPGEYTLRTNVIGYARLEHKITLSAAEEVVIEVALAPNAIPLNPITVVARHPVATSGLAGFYARAEWSHKIGLGDIITKADIEKRNAARTAQLLSAISGARITGDTVRFRRSGVACRPRVYVDGIGYSNGTVDVPVEMVAGIEVYRSASQMPAEFYDRTGCGLVLIWTERPVRQGKPVSWKWLLLAAGLATGVILIVRKW
jgi:hypothetical protein